ncbi:modification methylase HemK [Suhomyces tanzawaensis NRRL Y-17324]|uniref:Modification methylase HemK n=1 Tax=Suhomyces tanzawaensis NRRL Y-17324 TaxID=984487 RepID=A0A1E4SKE1_9ASCO|nr:modification methylase HemK [Suhomyces tanzawaensis NRRL Y-17324]ODV79971.1 modification methylase HemK [Suhomyces tanzawaensis NRRL Y-17324]
MPRISPRLVREALWHSRLLPPLLRANPEIAMAKQELRWIKNELPRDQWRDAITRRSKLEPLQYILGTQPFGELDIECRPGVLIPRWETEEWVTKLSNLVASRCPKKNIHIVDACTGSGCVPLLLNHQLNGQSDISSQIVGFDISLEAFNLANHNLARIDNSTPNVKFKQLNLFSESLVQELAVDEVDILVSNPPYIPKEDFYSSMYMNGVEKSVRLYEPALALIGENEFYEALLAQLILPMKIKAFVFELGYQLQVDFVKTFLEGKGWEVGSMNDGSGKIRCVLGWRKEMDFMQKLAEEKSS